MATHDEIKQLVQDVEFCTSISKALTSRVLGPTIPILIEDKGFMRQHGTGTLLRIGQRSFLVTAGHVYRDACKADLLLYVGSMKSQVKPLLGRFHCTEDDGPFDLGIRELEPEVVAILQAYTFVRIYDVHFPIDKGPDLYCVVGYPTFESKEATPENKTIGLRQMFFLTYLYEGNTNFEHYDERYHILLHFKRADAVAIFNNDDKLPPHVRGVSGCGIWKTNIANIPRDQWTPDMARLIAVESCVYEKSGAMRGTIWSGVTTMIREAFPELKPAMDLSLPR